MSKDDKIIYKEFGERLKQLRKNSNLTQVQLAQSLGMTQSQIYKYEKGVQKISMSTLQLFANFFNVSVSELIGSNNTSCEPAFIEEIKSYNLTENEISDLMNYVRFIVTKRN